MSAPLHKIIKLILVDIVYYLYFNTILFSTNFCLSYLRKNLWNYLLCFSTVRHFLYNRFWSKIWKISGNLWIPSGNLWSLICKDILERKSKEFYTWVLYRKEWCLFRYSSMFSDWNNDVRARKTYKVWIGQSVQ